MDKERNIDIFTLLYRELKNIMIEFGYET